ncbi:hypothetical protein RRG08_023661 [Elysia crispata]|uniref:Uncharacterized protein n=1 Tax=Elysia crispata TaxID=231223 RepID=A0AAE1CLA4_9GAST|nr:hypothetical protein RRG08_023661 [Elysia crispata]
MVILSQSWANCDKAQLLHSGHLRDVLNIILSLHKFLLSHVQPGKHRSARGASGHHLGLIASMDLLASNHRASQWSPSVQHTYHTRHPLSSSVSGRTYLNQIGRFVGSAVV